MVLILSQDQDGTDEGFRHIVMFDTTTVNAPRQALTQGKFVVTSILGWNHENNLMYVIWHIFPVLQTTLLSI